jgi:hypothetical protein
MTRATSDLLSNSNPLQKVDKIECLTLENDETQEHSFDLLTGELESENPEKADPVLNAIISMLKTR